MLKFYHMNPQMEVVLTLALKLLQVKGIILSNTIIRINNGRATTRIPRARKNRIGSDNLHSTRALKY